MLGNELVSHITTTPPLVYPASDQYMVYWHPDFMAQEIMTGVSGWNKVSRFTLLVLEDLGYFIADYSRADYYNYLRSDLVARTSASNTLPMSIPIKTVSGGTTDAEIAVVNAECVQTGAASAKPFN